MYESRICSKKTDIIISLCLFLLYSLQTTFDKNSSSPPHSPLNHFKPLQPSYKPLQHQQEPLNLRSRRSSRRRGSLRLLLDGQEKLELRRKILLRVQPVTEVDPTDPAVRVNLHA